MVCSTQGDVPSGDCSKTIKKNSTRCSERIQAAQNQTNICKGGNSTITSHDKVTKTTRSNSRSKPIHSQKQEKPKKKVEVETKACMPPQNKPVIHLDPCEGENKVKKKNKEETCTDNITSPAIQCSPYEVGSPQRKRKKTNPTHTMGKGKENVNKKTQVKYVPSPKEKNDNISAPTTGTKKLRKRKVCDTEGTNKRKSSLPCETEKATIVMTSKHVAEKLSEKPKKRKRNVANKRKVENDKSHEKKPVHSLTHVAPEIDGIDTTHTENSIPPPLKFPKIKLLLPPGPLTSREKKLLAQKKAAMRKKKSK